MTKARIPVIPTIIVALAVLRMSDDEWDAPPLPREDATP